MGNIFLYIISGLIAAFTIFLFIIYLISKKLRSYPCYFNIYFCIIIALDNIIRFIPADKNETVENASILCKLQAIFLSLFDKLFIISITSYSIINYIIMIHTKVYSEHTGKIYIILVVVSFCLSLGLTLLFFSKGISNSNLEDAVCYVKTGDNLKRITDSIYTCILLLIDIFCITRILIKIRQYIMDCELKNNMEKKGNLKRHFWRFLIDLLINFITFGFVFALINKWAQFKDKHVKDIIYIIICLINELFFTINEESFNIIMRVLTCNKVEKFQDKQQEELLIQNENIEEGEDEHD